MVTYVKTMLGAKLGQKGALFVEYALILAFVLVVGVVFLNVVEWLKILKLNILSHFSAKEKGFLCFLS